MEPDPDKLGAGLGPFLGGNPDGSWDVSDFEAYPSRSQRASSDIRYFLAYGTRMGCLDRIGRHYYTHETKTQNRISNSSRAAVSGGIREDPLQSLDLSDCSSIFGNKLPTEITSAENAHTALQSSCITAHPETAMFVATWEPGWKDDNSIITFEFARCASAAHRSGVLSYDSQGLLELSH